MTRRDAHGSCGLRERYVTTPPGKRKTNPARKFLLANVTETSGHRRTTGRTDREEFLWVYGRAGQPCRRCTTPIRGLKHTADGRISFWCPVCQK